MPTIVLDSGALIALESRRSVITAILKRAVDTDAAIHIPAAVLAQVWRDARRQTRLSVLIKDHRVRVIAFDQSVALAVGYLCGRKGTADVVEASVAIEAQRAKAVVVTTDPDDLRALDPALEIFAI